MKPKSDYRILVVDDQKSMRGLATYFLKQIDFQDIDEAESAREMHEAQVRLQTAEADLALQRDPLPLRQAAGPHPGRGGGAARPRRRLAAL